MERSQSYTSFETTGSLRKQHLTNSLTKTVNNNNNNNSNYNNYNENSFYKNKYASTSSLNLRKALELRQTQLQLQQQQQREEQQRQQWQLLFEQQRQQQQILLQQQQQQQQQQFQQLQQLQQLQNAVSNEKIDGPFYLNTLNNLQQLQVRRQKTLQRQKTTTTSMDNLNFPHDDDNKDDDKDFGVILREDLRNHILKCANKSHTDVDKDNTPPHSPINLDSPPCLPVLPSQKMLRFQRQRPLSEAALNCYRVASPTSEATDIACSLTTATEMTPITTISDRRRLQPFEQALSFDSAISSATAHSGNTTSTQSIGNTMAGNTSPLSARHQHFGKLKRDNSLHSDSSRYSSVDSLLEARKPDPEAILINLGFGPAAGTEDILSRIPKRFLKPSQVRGIDTDAFVRRIQLASSLTDHSIRGYRGLIGNPDLPPSTIVAKIMQRFEVNERKKSLGSIEQTIR